MFLTFNFVEVIMYITDFNFLDNILRVWFIIHNQIVFLFDYDNNVEKYGINGSLVATIWYSNLLQNITIKSWVNINNHRLIIVNMYPFGTSKYSEYSNINNSFPVILKKDIIEFDSILKDIIIAYYNPKYFHWDILFSNGVQYNVIEIIKQKNIYWDLETVYFLENANCIKETTYKYESSLNKY